LSYPEQQLWEQLKGGGFPLTESAFKLIFWGNAFPVARNEATHNADSRDIWLGVQTLTNNRHRRTFDNVFTFVYGYSAM
jgi:hypothetical protein